MLFIGCYDNNLYALNAADGQFQWKYAADGGIVTRPIVYDNNVIFGSEDKRLHVVGVRAGKVVWTYYTEGRYILHRALQMGTSSLAQMTRTCTPSMLTADAQYGSFPQMRRSIPLRWSRMN